MHDRKDVEARTLRYGREIFARLEGAGPVPLGPAWWDERMMEWTMGDEALKLQLFRFVDVLPMLRTPASISRHLREYFAQAGDRLPGWLSWLTRRLPESGPLGRLLAFAARHGARRLARRFIAGSDVAEVLGAVAALRRRSLGFTVDLLGEATITEKEARQYQGEYLTLVEGLAGAVNAWPENPVVDRDESGPLPRVNVSVKLSSLYSQFDPIDPDGTSRSVRERLRPILRLARRNGVFINIDMEQYSFKDTTIQIFEEVLEEPEFRDWPDVGIAIQAYLKECPADLHGLAEWARRRGTPVWVRLVKGAYWDYENIVAAQQNWPCPVWEEKWQTDACYERMTEFLMDHSAWLRPALGSHNVRTLAHALAVADVQGLPPHAFELQMLYGMADPIKTALVNMGRRVRVYTPYGQLLPGMAYLVRRLLENTANESFLRASFTEHVPVEQLLRNPLDVGRERGETLPEPLVPRLPAA
jgi:RHH-type proline utilization regulon transcriptional repressor/proline dehydrogenase/delta 1-pyrroline-5-carboxylate dehydrogenase